jgi:putative spermidine/putrescine transport system ATP-binding protein
LLQRTINTSELTMIGGASIELIDVRRSFGRVNAVDGVSLQIAPGEFFTLLGPSGSGKTTLLHLLAGFQHPEHGDIVIDGNSVKSLPPFRRGIGVVFQSYALFPHLTVAENVAFPLRVRHVSRAETAKRVQAALTLVDLGDYGERRISQLSGGQQQRVALARAFVFEPRLLLMDEPLSALDAKLRRGMRLEIKALQKKLGVTVVYVTHDQDEALAMSDRIAVMNNGRIEQLDTPAGLYERPASRFVADFIGESNLIEGTVIGPVGEGIVEVATASQRYRVAVHEMPAVGSRVDLAIRQEAFTIRGAETMSNNLSGRVVSTVYGGDHSIVQVDIGDDMVVTVKKPAQDGVSPTVGQSVTIGWEVGRAVVISS